MKKLMSVLLALSVIVLLLLLIFGKTRIKYFPEKPIFSQSHFNKDYYQTDKLLFVNVWATWCAPCVAEFPVLERFSYKNQGATFLTIAMDEDTIRLKDFINKHPALKKHDVTLKNFIYRDLIYEKIELGNSINAGGILKLESQQIPYFVLIKGKKILYKSSELDTIALQRAIDRYSD